MKRYRAILTYARFSTQNLSSLKEGLDNLGIEVKWIAAHNKEEVKSKKIFPNAKNARWASYRYNEPWAENLDKNLYDQLLGDKKDTALPIVERYGPFEGGSMEAEIRLAHDFSIAHNMILDSQPDLIIFAKTPESGLQYCLYIIAKYFNIQTCLTRMGAFPHTRIFCTDMDAPILDSNWQAHRTIVPVCNISVSEFEPSELTLQNVKNILSEHNSIPEYMKIKGISQDSSNQKFIQFNTEITKENVNRDKHKKTNNAFYLKKIMDHYEDLALSLDDIDWHKNIHFFPLHYQPEVNTMPVGYEYVNQLKAIKLISDQLDSNDLLVVKEHPSTFMRGKININFRSKSFYNWISKLKNVIMVSANINSSYLINRSNTVISITGTAGMEAMIKQKKVLAFGNASYINGPGVFKISSNTDLSLIINQNSNINAGSSKVKEFLAALDSCAYHYNLQYNNHDELLEEVQSLFVLCLLAGLNRLQQPQRL